MKFRVLAVTAALVVGGGLVVAPPAQAEDRRPCVSRTEWRGIKPSTQREMEARWDVRGMGVPQSEVLLGEGRVRKAVRYKACGYSLDEVWLLVVYRRSTGLALYGHRLKSPDATPHGHV